MAHAAAAQRGPTTSRVTLRPGAPRIAVAVAACAAMLLVVVATAQGPGLSPDSVIYMASGVNLADSHGLVNLADEPLTVFAPAVSAYVAVADRAGVDPATAMQVLSIACIGATVVLGGVLLRRAVGAGTALIASLAVLAVAQALFDVSSMAWSEPPFIVITLAYLLVLGQVWERRRLSGRAALALAALCWTAFLVRYAGASLIATAGIVLLVRLRPLDRRALGRIAGFGLLAAAVPVGWMLRNHAADGTFLGPRSPSPDSPWDVLVRILSVLGAWVIPVDDLSTGVLALIGAAVLALLATGVRVAIGHLATTVPASEGDAPGPAATIGTCALFAVVYTAFLAYASVSTAFTPIDARYLSPVYVPLVVLAAAAMVAAHQAPSPRRVPVAVATVVVALVAIGQLTTTLADARDGAADGIGLNVSAVLDSPLGVEAARLAAGAPDPPVVYSNKAHELWVETRMQPIHFAPRRLGVRGRPITGELEAFARDVACARSPVLLVFYLVSDARFMSLRTIKTAVDVEPLGRATDGVVFRVSPKPGGPPCATSTPAPVRHIP